MKNPYFILKVPRNATQSQIKTAYRIQARKYHPDINPSSSSVEKMKDINWAYKILSNPIRRANWDWVNQAHRPTQRTPGPRPQKQQRGPPPYRPKPSPRTHTTVPKKGNLWPGNTAWIIITIVLIWTSIVVLNSAAPSNSNPIEAFYSPTISTDNLSATLEAIDGNGDHSERGSSHWVPISVGNILDDYYQTIENSTYPPTTWPYQTPRHVIFEYEIPAQGEIEQGYKISRKIDFREFAKEIVREQDFEYLDVFPLVYDGDVIIRVAIKQISERQDGEIGIALRHSSDGYYLFKLLGDHSYQVISVDNQTQESQILLTGYPLISKNSETYRYLGVYATGSKYFFFIDKVYLGYIHSDDWEGYGFGLYTAVNGRSPAYEFTFSEIDVWDK